MLEIKDISKKFPDFELNGISFRVAKGDYFILLGESGAGKSMILETIAGLVRPDSGEIWLDGKEISHTKIQERKIGLVFQDHAVFPHLTVMENIAFALHAQGLSREEKRLRVKEIARLLGISGLLHRSPTSLSGGELQRVALGRTLIQKPRVLLLDEPLASLDIQLKRDLRRLLRSIHQEGQTIIHVTHDYEEALALGTNIAVIHKGQVIQTGTPEAVFTHPESEFVAHFVGVKNFFSVHLEIRDQITFAITNNNIPIRIVSESTNEDAFILIRGEDILVSNTPVETSATNNFPGKIVEVVPGVQGVNLTVNIGIEMHALITRESVEKLNLKAGGKCWIHFKATAVKMIAK
ncbi:MAG: ABC transporter ATP-binding protein [Bacteroidales bacterium]|nr:ABC transporter ATP-binding protein [Bacteroidales bacterium]